MLHRFPYPDFEPLEIPDRNLAGVFEAKGVRSARDPDAIVEEALEAPIGSERLDALAKGKRRVVILVDDYTRITPADRILPKVLARIEAAGVTPSQITILVALATHRPMTAEEHLKKVGRGILDRYRVLNHDAKDPRMVVPFGETKSGIPISINALAVEADLLLGIGLVVPHRVAGFSGGGKIVQPGVCGEVTTGRTHWISALLPGTEVLGVRDNPVRDEIDEVARAAGLSFVVNTVHDASGRIVGCFAGDFVAAHRKAAALSRRVSAAAIPEPFDIVVTDSHPNDIELWQGAKGYYASEGAVRPGGVVLLVSPCPEGIARSHPEVREHGYRKVEEVKALVAAGKLPDLAAAAHIAHVGRIVRDRARGVLVSNGVSRADCDRIGLRHARTPRDGLAAALDLAGRDARIGVFRNGGDILPVLPRARTARKR